MKKAKTILKLLFLAIIFFASCDKSGTMIPSPWTAPQPLTPVPDSLIWYTWDNNDPSVAGFWTISVFGDAFKGIVSRFDSTYYHDHVKVYLKFFGDSASWKIIRYSPHDYTGRNGYDIYFTDKNRIIADPGLLGIIVKPRINICAKPTAFIDFSKKVAVRILIN